MKYVLIISMIILSLFIVSSDSFSSVMGAQWVCEYPTVEHSFTTESHNYKLVGTCYPLDGHPPIPITIYNSYNILTKTASENQEFGDGRFALLTAQCDNDPILYNLPYTYTARHCSPDIDVCIFRYLPISEATIQAWISEAANAKPPAPSPPAHCSNSQLDKPPVLVLPKSSQVFAVGPQDIMFSVMIPCGFTDNSSNFFRIEYQYYSKEFNSWATIDTVDTKMLSNPYDKNQSLGVKPINLSTKAHYRYRALDNTKRSPGDSGTHASAWSEWRYFWIGKPEIEGPAGSAAALVADLKIKGFSLSPPKPKANQKFDLNVEVMNNGGKASTPDQKYHLSCKVVTSPGRACPITPATNSINAVVPPKGMYQFKLQGLTGAKGTYEVTVELLPEGSGKLKSFTFDIDSEGLPVTSAPAAVQQQGGTQGSIQKPPTAVQQQGSSTQGTPQKLPKAIGK